MKQSLVHLFVLILLVTLTSASTGSSGIHADSSVPYVGVNLAGAEFGNTVLPGTYGTNYIYPTFDEVNYFFSKGMNTFRIPFRWERLQNSRFGDFSTDEFARLDSIVNYATGRGNYIILDPHNGARYYGNLIGSPTVVVCAFAGFWAKLASHYRDNDRVIFGLMNEPHDMPTEQWRDIVNTTIAAIRSVGATNLILVPGNGYSGAHSWYDSWYGTPNAVEMLNVTDPAENYAFEVHQYLDSDSSGLSDLCVSSTVGSGRLTAFTQWLRQHNKRGFLSEFAGGRNSTCLGALDDMLSYVNGNSDVWLGWTYWAAGPWWGDYPFTLEPKNGVDRPQMSVLEAYLLPRYHAYLPTVMRE